MNDRLAQIEAAVVRWCSDSTLPDNTIPASPDDVLALVEIAKAARDAEPVVDELIGWINTDIIGCLEVEQRGEQARLAIRSALARLDSDDTTP